MLTNTPIRIAIADDHNMFRDILAKRLNLEDIFEVVIVAPNGHDLLETMEKIDCDIILLDMNMPVKNGKETIHSIRKKYGELPRIIVLSMFDEKLIIKKCIKSGANSFMSKGCDYTELVRCIMDTYKDGGYFTEAITPELVNELKSDERITFKAAEGEPLTKTEIKVIQMLCKGYRSEDIAREWSRSKKTIENHRFRISQKLNIDNQMLLMEYAIIHGIHDPEI